MYKKFVTIMAAAVLTLTLAGNALATFADLELIRIYYDRSGNEIATDLGKVKDILAAPTTTATGSFGSLATGYVSYFALDRATSQLWVSGITTTASIVTGTANGLTSLKSGTTPMYALYNTQGGTNYTGLASLSNSYKNKISATQGNMAFSIVNGSRLYTEASLASLISTGSGSVTQTLYFWNNANTTVTAEKTGVAVATITTDYTGKTTISTVLTDTFLPVVTIDTPPPTTSTSATVSITFTATDNIGVTGYLLNESSTPPTATDPGWTSISSATSFGLTTDYTFGGLEPGVPTRKWLYVWARDEAGNVSAVKGSATDITLSNTTTPAITWVAPGAITYGTPLSDTQLNATAIDPSTSASVPGTFAYSPVSGSVLDAGTQSLTVTFTPTDNVKYTSATKQVDLAVNQAPLSITANSAGKVYGQTVSFSGSEFSANGLQNSDTIGSVALASNGAAATAAVAGSPYPITAATATGGTFKPGNYSITYNNGLLTVNPATLTVTADAKSKTLGAADPELTYTVTGFVNNETNAVMTGSLARAPGENIGVYAINLGTLSAGGNYTINFTGANLTINNKTAPIITWATPAPITYGTPLSGTQLNATANVPGTFTYNPSPGSVLNAGTRALSATFVPNDAVTYNDASASVTLQVNQAVATVTLGGLNQTYDGSAKPATATTNPPGLTVVFSYGGSATAPTAAGSYDVTGTISVSNYTGSATGTMTIAKAIPVITWANPAAIIVGSALSDTQLNAKANVAGSFTYTPAVGTVMNSTGAQPLTTTFTPADTANYDTATASVTIMVEDKKSPVITWAAPAAISYGTPLSATQLNATASVPGSFTYTPAAGTALNAGSQTLTVTFKPQDTTTYNDVTASVTLTVNKAIPAITWKPASIIYGTALSASQLNASASVPGTYVYTPPLGTVVKDAGSLSLSVAFTPSDSDNYAAATATAALTAKYSSGGSDGTAAPTLTDALKVLKFAVGIDNPNAGETIYFDVAPLGPDGKPKPDGIIDLGDALVILKRAVGSITAW